MTSATLRDAIDAAREQHFVGREPELARLDALCLPDGPSLAYVNGPGGVGKSELLQTFARRWQRLGAAVARVDAQSIVAHEQGMMDAIRNAEAVLPRSAELLVIDSLDHVWHLEGWIRETLLPSLPLDLRVVLGGREPLHPTWLASPAWRDRLDSISLENWSEAQALDYLGRARVEERHRRAIFRIGFGHPLTTALLAEVSQGVAGEFPHLGRLPDTVQTVLSQLLRDVLSDAQRLALWSTAMVPAMNEQLLSRMIPDEFEPALFEWLRARTFIRSGARGLVLHDVARAALTADVQWRAPDTRRRLVERALDEYLLQMEADKADIVRTGRSVVATMQLFGHHVSLGSNAEYYPSTLEAADWPKLEAMITRHEGEESGKLARFWRDRGAEIMVARGRNGEAAGCVITLWLEQIDPDDAARDPGVLPAYQHLESAGVFNDGRAFFIRFWTGAESYQSFNSPVAGVLITRIMTQAFTDDTAFGFSQHGDAMSVMAVAGTLKHFSECDFRMGERDYQVMGHDYREDPPPRWFRRVLGRTIRQPVPSSLDRETFEAGVRGALRSFHQVERLAESPLLRSRLASGLDPNASRADTARQLQSLIQGEIEGLSGETSDEEVYRVLKVTYLGKPVKQAAAAAELNMSYSTYRRRHSAAVDRLIDILWERDAAVS